MRLDMGRRTALFVATAAVSPLVPLRGTADGRTSAQTVGIDTPSIGGIVWGGRDRCDPTEPTCTAGGRESGGPADAPPVPGPRASPPTERFAIEVSVSGQPAGRITLGLWSDTAPASCATFSKLARGVLTSDPEDEPAKLEKSAAIKILRDKAVVLGDLKQQGGSLRIMAGRTKPQRFPVVPPQNDDANSLSHDAAGLLSVRRGGGSFAFVLTPRANAELDREWIVIGQVLDAEGMQVLARLNGLATNNYDQSPLASVKIARVVSV